MSPFDTSKRMALTDSSHVPLPGVIGMLPVHPLERLRANVYLRRRTKLPPAAEIGALPPHRRKHLDHEQFEKKHGADPAHVKKIEKFAAQHGLDVTGSDLSHRTVTLEGTAANFAGAFSTSFHRFFYPGWSYRSNVGALHVPSDLASIVTGVLGLDERIHPVQHAVRRAAWDPMQVARAQRAALGAAQQRGQMHLARLQTSAALTRQSHVDMATTLAEASADTLRTATFAAFEELQIKTPPLMAEIYNFPADADGSGETIGIIELGGGWNAADMAVYFNFLGLPVPQITNVSVMGGLNAPGQNDSADGEVALDIQVAGGAAPGAKLVVYFAPLTAATWIEAMQTAIHDRQHNPSVITASWDVSEAAWLQAPSYMAIFEEVLADAAQLGITIFCSAGDYGAAGEIHDGLLWTDYPASSPHVTGVGGTTLVSQAATIVSETVWNSLPLQATGGGVSILPLPEWQQNANVPRSLNPGGAIGRGVPDVTSNGNPETGYLIQYDGKTSVWCGTSSGAPLWAALIARINQSLGTRVGYLNPWLYQHGVPAMRDVVAGNNGAYQAAAGWDACSGWGSPDGTKLRDLLATE